MSKRSNFYRRMSRKKTTASHSVGNKQESATFFDFANHSNAFFAGKGNAEASVHKKCDNCEQEDKQIKKKENASSSPGASNKVASQINSLSGGHPLSAGTRSFFEPRFGSDLSDVKIHDNSHAHELTTAVNAKAFAYKNNIVFNKGQYNTTSFSGKHLLAHELTHVLQNKGRASGSINRSPLSDDLRNVWTSQGKGPFFEKLRSLTVPADTDTHVFIRTLMGDDRWLAQNIITYGREANWPIHLRVQREMKGWGDSGGKGAVFNILRAANGSQASNADLENTLHTVFAPGSDDVWLADNLQLYGAENNWPIQLKVIREMKGWADTGGMPAVLQLLRNAAAAERNNVSLTAVLNVLGSLFGNSTLLLNLQAYGPETNWPQAVLTPGDNFAGRSMFRFGVGETIDLSFTSPMGLSAAQLGGLQWSITSIFGAGSTLVGGTDGLGTFTGGDTLQILNLDLKAVSGPNAGRSIFTRPIVIVPPNGALMVKTTGVQHTFATCTIGFRGTVYMRPTDVSYKNAQWSEGDAAAAASGSLAFMNGRMHCASNPCNVWMSIGTGNAALGSNVFTVDTVALSVTPPQFTPGVFHWPIAWQYKVGTGAKHAFFNANQIFTIDAAGTVTAAKAGAGPFSKNTFDPTSTY